MRKLCGTLLAVAVTMSASGEAVCSTKTIVVENVSQTEEFVLLTTEAKWYRNDHMTGKGVPELEAAAASGDEFLIDYVRVYDIEETE